MPLDDRDTVTVGKVQLALRSHVEDVCGDAADSGFGSLLFDTDGRVSLHDGTRTWLYTTRRDSMRGWMSVVREFDLRSLDLGPSIPVLQPGPEDAWAVIHHVLQIAPGTCLALYSSGAGVRAAVAPAPNSAFSRDPDFVLQPADGWEHGGAGPHGWSLEANAAYVKIDEDSAQLEFWEGYDSYHRDEVRGDLGWARLAFDKTRGRLRLLSRHPDNPLDFRPDGFICARCGGNLASDVRIQGQRAFFYYARPDRSELAAYVALAGDPLFQAPTLRQAFDRPRGNEEVIEKFQTYMLDGTFHLLYESRLSNGWWRTGLRRYREVE